MNENKFIVKSLLMRGTSFPCFLWPAVDVGGGSLKFPVSNGENVIVDFCPIKEIEKYNLRIDEIDVKYESITLQIGKETRFAYAFSSDDYEIGTIKEIKRFVAGREEINRLNVYKKYELFCAIKDDKRALDLLEGIVKKSHSQKPSQEEKWAELELNYVQKTQKVPSDVLADHIKKILNNIKQVAEGSMSSEDAEEEFYQFARKYNINSLELKRSMQATIKVLKNKNLELADQKADNDRLRKENVLLRLKSAPSLFVGRVKPRITSVDQGYGVYKGSFPSASVGSPKPIWELLAKHDAENEKPSREKRLNAVVLIGKKMAAGAGNSN